MSQRPFRRRRKTMEDRHHLGDMQVALDESYHEQQHPSLLSSAIANLHHCHQHHHRLPEHQPIHSQHLDQSDIPNDECGHQCGQSANSTTEVTHKQRQQRHHHHHHHNHYSHRYSASRGCRRSPSMPAPSFSLPLLMSLSLVACVIMSLLNLTINQLQPNMFVSAVGTTSAAKSSTFQLQQQQFNSVIPYQSTTSSSTSTAMKARYKTMYACEDRQLTMDCDTGYKINLIRANFGRFSITQCNEQGQLDLSTDCMSPITFRIMQERCQDRRNCSVNATSSLFGDRCPKTRKYLEVHFQCLLDADSVHLGQNPPSSTQQILPAGPTLSGELKPPNNPTLAPAETVYPGHPEMRPSDTYRPQPQPTPVINSQIMNSKMAIDPPNDVTNNLPDFATRDPIVVSLRHMQIANMSKPRCYQWDANIGQWTDRGASIVQTNLTHTICAFDQVTSYVLVMDYAGPMPTISNPSQTEPHPMTQPPYTNSLGPADQDLLKTQPTPLDQYMQPHNQFDTSKIIQPPSVGPQQQQQQQTSSSSKLFTLFGYLLGIIVVAVALMTLTLVASSMRASAGAVFKSLGNIVPFGGPKYKQRRQDVGPPNKNLLVVNNSNGHQFIYAPASTTKISSSSSTHILAAGQPNGGGPHQGTLHRLQQQQLYSGNGATLSSLSAAGAQSNNYYYGLMGLNPLFQQQQQQQQHFSQHHLNQPQIATAHSQQVTSYNHQANKSSMSNESANSSSSSSGVESGSTSMQQQHHMQQQQHHMQQQQQQQQQQQVQTQQACLVSAMNNNDFNLMGHHISNYGRHQPQQQNLFATMKNSNFNAHHQQQQQHQPTLTVNAHYSTSAGMQSINMTPEQAAMLHNRQTSSQMRDHIYECVDDDKPYMARLLMPTGQQQQQQQLQQQIVEQQPHLMQGQPQQAFSTWRDTLRHKCVALPQPKVV